MWSPNKTEVPVAIEEISGSNADSKSIFTLENFVFGYGKENFDGKKWENILSK